MIIFSTIHIFLLLGLFGIIGAIIGSSKGLMGIGFILSAILGPIGIILTLVLKGNRIECPLCKCLMNAEAKICHKCGKNGSETLNEKTCPQCAETIKKMALLCRFCGHKFDPEEIETESKNPHIIESAPTINLIEFNVTKTDILYRDYKNSSAGPYSKEKFIQWLEGQHYTNLETVELPASNLPFLIIVVIFFLLMVGAILLKNYK